MIPDQTPLPLLIPTNNFMDNKFIEQARQLLGTSDNAGNDWPQDKIRATPLTPDGSLRRFCRIEHKDGRKAVAIAPPPDDTAGLQEAISGWHIGRHLFATGAPVPELYGFEEQSGLLVCEDLGDQRLHDLVQEKGIESEQIIQLYRQTVSELARMQVRGSQGFKPDWCWDTPRYDRALMLERESGYFLRALCRDFLQLEIDEEKIAQDFHELADKASQADATFFLHRDFQSRNIMIQQDRVRFIDYQAGRLGPLAYDLASLLIDPYAALPDTVQDELLEHYLDTLTLCSPMTAPNSGRNICSWPCNAISRSWGPLPFSVSNGANPFSGNTSSLPCAACRPCLPKPPQRSTFISNRSATDVRINWKINRQPEPPPSS